MTDHKVRRVITQYISARRKLISLGESHPELLGGNDNMIGRIGEYIALRFLQKKKQKPKKVQSKSNKGFDLVEGKRRTQVKVITQENKKGRSVRLKKPWNQFVLICLDENYKPTKIGFLTAKQHNKALKENQKRKWSKEPLVKSSMLGERGLISRYGEVHGTFKY